MTDKVRTLGPGVLKIGDSGSAQMFDADCTSVKVTPDTSEGDELNFLDGHTEREESKTTWKISGNIKEDYSDTGVQAFCWNNQGKSLPLEFVPSKHGKMKVVGKAIIVPLEIGGDVKNKNDIGFEFSVQDLNITFDHNPES